MGVYVDGFNLYHGIHDWSRCKWLWLDLVALGQSLRNRNDLVKLHYFTAPVLNNSGAASRQETYQKALIAQHGSRLAITQGRYQVKQLTCRSCGSSYRSYEEKETDVSIASTLIGDAARGLYQTALLISADSDLIPAIRQAQSLDPDLFIVAAFPPNRNSDELKRALPASFHIGRARIREAQLPETVTDAASGRAYRRPSKWRSE